MSANLPLHRPERTLFLRLLLGMAGLGLGFAAFSPPGWAFLDAAITWAEGLMAAHALAGAAVFFLFSALSAMLAFTSSTVLIPSANLAWGEALTFLLLWGGWVAGAVTAFAIGWLAGPILVRGRHGAKLRRYQHYASRHMTFWLVLLLCLAIPSEIPGYLFGSLRYPLPRFLAAIALAESGYALGAVLAGESLVGDGPGFFLAAVGALVLVAVGAGWLLRRVNRPVSATPPAPEEGKSAGGREN